MLGYVQKRKGEKLTPPIENLVVPPSLIVRLRPWIDVEEVGDEGFWLWLGSVLPLLPQPADGQLSKRSLLSRRRTPYGDLARLLSQAARERARVSVMLDRVEVQNRRMLVRIRSLEAALRTYNLAAHNKPTR